MSKYVDDFRPAAHQAVDWAADYLENTRRYPVQPRVKPGDLVDSMPASGPDQGESLEAILKDFEKLVVPSVMHWNHPGFMAYFACTGSTPAIIAEMLSATLNTNGIHWKTSPAVGELEQVTMKWLRQWVGLPDTFFGEIFDTASISTMHAISAARVAADPNAREEGSNPNLTIYCSEQAHSSIDKGVIALGVGHRNLRKIPVDADFRMKPDALEAAIQADIAAGKKPFCVVAAVGTTSTTSIDPVPAIADIAKKYKMWLHIDAAYAGSAAMVPELKPLFVGFERADSIVMNAHKWMFTPSDCSVFFCRRPDVLQDAFSLTPEYLRKSEDPRAINLMDYGVPLGRRFRALKLWFVMRYFGREGITKMIRTNIELAQKFAGWVDADARFERVAPAPLSAVCFRYKGTDAENKAILEAVNATGKVFMSHTELLGKYILRVAIGNRGTAFEDVEGAWKLIQGAVPK